MSVQLPPRPQKGQPISSDYFLQLWDYLRSLEPHGDLSTTVVSRNRSGTTISAPRPPTVAPPRIRAIVAKITADNEDGTYEGVEQKNTSGTFADADAYQGMTFDSSNNGDLIEINGLVGVPVGAFVNVIRVANTDGNYLWYFDGSAASTLCFWAKITGESPAGQYNFTQLQSDASTSSGYTGTGAIEVHGRLGIPTDTIVLMMESTQPGTTRKYRFVDDTGEPGTAQDASFTGNHTEAARTSTEWDREDQGSSRGTKRTVCTGVEYDDTGDEVLYAYYEDWTFDADGHLILISEERRETIDEAESC